MLAPQARPHPCPVCKCPPQAPLAVARCTGGQWRRLLLLRGAPPPPPFRTAEQPGAVDARGDGRVPHRAKAGPLASVPWSCSWAQDICGCHRIHDDLMPLRLFAERTSYVPSSWRGMGLFWGGGGGGRGGAAHLTYPRIPQYCPPPNGLVAYPTAAVLSTLQIAVCSE